ncbi:PepSY domain-containing protein [Streptomyces sp. DSM 44915]|uniref:PepSY domain-containing protein n=1 Tax=Streptomyces chisholmiae TaxID=3075540 RepID=A0ABU2JI68_9ACTN|nr:PepSY domain-containing protein [Streptomyces sp. DSM 44915]MDT0264685.1 PepSY domain-containing protein [Streptomyces sp. DSM 44915]
MKRNMIVALATAGAVVGGGTLAGIALADGDRGSRTESAALSSTSLEIQEDGSTDDTDDRDERDDRADDGGSAPVAGDSAALRAIDTALAAAPGVVTEIDLERDDDDPRGWEIEIYGEGETWHHVLVNEEGTEVLAERDRQGDDDDDDDDWDDDLAAARSLLAAESHTDAAMAVAIAEQHTGATLREADVDDGRWELELRGEDGTEYELSINLQNGDIVEEERDRDDDDDDDRDDRDDDGRDDDDDRDDRDDRDDDGRDD